MMRAESEPPRLLPVSIVVKRSFVYAWESRAILAAPCAIYAAATILADLLLAYAVAPDDKTAVFALTGAEELLAMAFAVGIHRFVLLGEAARGAGFFRWDRNLVRYVLTALPLFIVAVSVSLGAGGMSGGSGDPPGEAASGAALALLALVVCAIVVIFCRLSLLLPSAALGDDAGPRLIWAKTRRNGFRLATTTMAVLAPFIGVEFFLLSLNPVAEATGARGFLVTVALSLMAPIELIALTVVLSLQYDALVRGNGPAADRAT